MKKIAFALTLLALLLALPALAQEARDLTLDCDITVASKGFTRDRLFDRDYNTYWNGTEGGKTLTILSPEPVFGLYISWMEAPRAFRIEQKIAGDWQARSYDRGPFQHAYYELDGATEIRLVPEGKSKAWFGMEELFVLGEGSLPGYVQRWELPDRECDLLLLFAHPDDEALFFGGTLPTYAGDRGLDVVVAVLTPSARYRMSELLNSLWVMGVTRYPVIGPFHDSFSTKLDKAYKEFGRSKTQRFAVDLLRAYRPRVVVSHDVQGEYGHGMHRLCADLMLYAFDAAADAGKFSESATTYGTWQASKLYLHLYPENPVVLDWDQPLTAFMGRTGFEMAQLGYAQHGSQQRLEQFQVEPKDSQYSSYHFGLAKTTVGPDFRKNDFMENLGAGGMQVAEP